MLAEAYPFVRWSASHWAALVAVFLATTAFLWWGSRLGEPSRRRFCRCLGAAVLLLLLGEHCWRFCVDDYGSWENNLPLHFCSLMMVVSFVALWFRKRWACAMVYFGVLTASIQGLITPAMANGYPSAAFFVFFASHGILLLAALAVPVLLGWRARGYDDVRSVLLMDAYIVFIIPLNIWLGTNYAYTQGSPVPGCLLDYMGPAPWYYCWANLPVLMIFRLMMLPVHDATEA